ncbi:MAG: hypothetical protein COS34_07975 [Lysobacterales bacterium CG02_land_8_20_14_3_00_62_12]|nr:MAG: hypothetical protein COS34_07975 [Xanthomonadales bacterium CG02_land_8_20_14_3_00_62_12]
MEFAFRRTLMTLADHPVRWPHWVHPAGWARRGVRVIAALLGSLLLAPNLQAEALLRGAPLLERWGADLVGAPPRYVGAAHDDQGRLYVANLEGLLRFDGDQWELLRLPGAVYASAVARAADGRIYVAGFDVFGEVTDAADGSMQLTDLCGGFTFAKDAPALANVWQIMTNDGAVHVRADQAIYTLGVGGNGPARAALPDSARRFAATRQGMVGRIADRGLVRVGADGTLNNIVGGEVFAERGVVAIVDQAERTLVFGEDAIYLLDDQRVQALVAGPMPEFAHNPANVVIVLADDSLMVGTGRGELLHFDAGLKLQDRSAIFPGTIEDLHVDGENGLWVIGDGDLVRLRWPAPWTLFGASHGLRGAVFDAEWHQGGLWIVGANGLFRLAPEPAVKMTGEALPWFDYEGFALHASDAGLLIAHRAGLLVLEDAPRPRPLLADTEAVTWLLTLPERRDRVFAVGEHSLWLLALEQGRWQLRANTKLGSISPTTALIGSHAGEVWLADSRSGPQRWRFNPDTGELLGKTVFDSRSGLPSARGSKLNLFRLDGQLFAVVAGQTWVLRGEHFSLDHSEPASLVERPEELVVKSSPVGTFAQTTRELLRRAPGTQRWERLQFGGSSVRGFEGTLVGQDGIVRIATWNGLLQYDPSQILPPEPPLTAKVRVTERSTSGKLTPVVAVAEGAGRAIAAGNAVLFRFGLVTMETGVQFRYRVSDIAPNWSEWRAERDLTLSRPVGGTYTLEIEARTRSERMVQPLRYAFRVEQRWYEGTLFKGMTALLGVLMIAAIALTVAWWRTRRLHAANLLLETRIADRTRELEIANRQLSELATVDSLTGILNRRALESGLSREWRRCLDQHRAIAALMIDVDHFKQYNDQFGHLEGDAVLRRLAAEFRQLYDPSRELLARFGGEEFVMILPDVALAEAAERAQQFCQRLRQAALPVTISIGVASTVPTQSDDPQQLLRRADVALYRAKHLGRDRIELAVD